jgi:hypothetical protein
MDLKKKMDMNINGDYVYGGDGGGWVPEGDEDGLEREGWWGEYD